MSYKLRFHEQALIMKSLKLIATLLLASLSLNLLADEAINPVEMTVYRSASCGCCGKWIAHAQQSQFNIKSVISDDMQAVKEKFGVPEKLASCHTAIVDGYVIEGHVPAEDIKKLLQTKPNLAGIAAPGMPLGSPGMEMAGQKDAYRVVSFDKEGKFSAFADH